MKEIIFKSWSIDGNKFHIHVWVDYLNHDVSADITDTWKIKDIPMKDGSTKKELRMSMSMAEAMGIDSSRFYNMARTKFLSLCEEMK